MNSGTRWKRLKLGVLTILIGGVPLITTASCDPRTGRFDFFRNQGGNSGYYYDPYYYDSYYYDDCLFDCGYGYDDFFAFDWF